MQSHTPDTAASVYAARLHHVRRTLKEMSQSTDGLDERLTNPGQIKWGHAGDMNRIALALADILKLMTECAES